MKEKENFERSTSARMPVKGESDQTVEMKECRKLGSSLGESGGEKKNKE